MSPLPHGPPRFPARAPSLRSALLVLALSSCAAAPRVPDAALGAATQAVASADRSGVSAASYPELAEARSKLAEARAAVLAEHMVTAEQLAREARIDAELALARHEAAKSLAVNQEMVNGTATLSNELQRKSGDQQ